MSKIRNCKVSIIVPVFRVGEKYIRRCMKNLLKQSLRDIEIICVCEKEDKAYKDLCAYEVKDDRVHVIEKKNMGVSSARNAGIEAARGKYIAFVDADDWVEKYAMETLYMTAEQYGAQIIAYGIWPTIEPRGDRRGIFGCSTNRNVLYRNAGMSALFYEHGSRPYIGNKFYSRDFLNDNNIRFDESIDIGEDQLLQFEAFYKAEIICFVKDKLYHYDIQRSDSAMNSCEEQQNTEDENFKLMMRIMEQKNKKYPSEYDKEYAAWILQYYGGLVNKDKQLTESDRNKIRVVQKYLQEMSAEKYFGDLPKEYQIIGRRFLTYEDSVISYDFLKMPYAEYDKYLAKQVLGVYEEITVNKGICNKIKRVYEALAFHEFRHLAVKALVRFGLY